MTDRELIKQMANEYFGEYAEDEGEWPAFYDYLLKRGYTRFRLSALGIGRDIEAGNVQGWRDN